MVSVSDDSINVQSQSSYTQDVVVLSPSIPQPIVVIVDNIATQETTDLGAKSDEKSGRHVL